MSKNCTKKTLRVDTFDDFLDKDLRESLHASSLKHYEHNLYTTDCIDITKSIIDCHGLALSTTAYFPYDDNCWNIFCLSIKEKVQTYVLEEFGYSSDYIIPFSCWGERVDSPQSYIKNDDIRNGIIEDSIKEHVILTAGDTPAKAIDYYQNKHIIRCVYNIISPENDNLYALKILYSNSKDTPSIIKVLSKPNRLTIFDGHSFDHQLCYPIKELHKIPKYNIIFDWYINDPFDVPDWILP